MTAEQWSLIEQHFDALRELPADAREAGLSGITDQDVKQEVTSLLEHTDGGSALAEMIGEMADTVEFDPVVLHDPGVPYERIGPFRLLRRLGQGGQGVVFEAVRDDGSFEQRTAIKIIKRDIDSDAARRRFRHERQILAGLEHPNIARLLDGGETPEGSPYLVMEFIEGRPLIAGAAGLPVRQKLELFLAIASAVAFAHRNLIVHRDLKPSNILVTESGDPKLLDFGIARLLDTGADADTRDRTATSAGMMTPDYASPEQVKGEPAGIASDIYSLGAVLYELLSGARPHRLESYSTAELYRAICLEEVKPPSAVAETPELKRQLRGDLDTLILTSLAKDPKRRYLSAEAFSSEIARFLEGRPLTVRPASAIERAWKFTKRNSLAVGAGAAIFLSLLGGITAATIQAKRAERRFGQVRELANVFLFQFYDQVTLLPGSTAVRASIVETARKYLDGLAAEAGNDRGLLFELAQAYQRLGTVQGAQNGASLGQVEGARQSYRRSLDLFERLGLTPESPVAWRLGAARTLLSWSELEYIGNHPNAAEPFVRRALALTENSRPADPRIGLMHAKAGLNLGEIRLLQGDPSGALETFELHRKSLSDLQTNPGSDPALMDEIVFLNERIARTKVRVGDLDGALLEFQQLVRRASCPGVDSNPASCRSLAIRLSWMADVYGAQDRPNLRQPEKAAPLYERSADIMQQLVSKDARDRQTRFDLAARYGKIGDSLWQSDPRRALRFYEQALSTGEALVSQEQVAALRGSYLDAISRPLILLGRTQEARRALSEAIKLAGKPQSYADRLGNLDLQILWARLLAAEGKLPEAERYLEQSVPGAEALRAAHPKDLTAVFFLSNIYRELAAVTSGEQRSQALMRSAAAWRAWPPTSYTKREEQDDLTAAKR